MKRTGSSTKRGTTGKAKKQSTDQVPSGLTETEQDLLSHLQNGYQLETERWAATCCCAGSKAAK